MNNYRSDLPPRSDYRNRYQSRQLEDKQYPLATDLYYRLGFGTFFHKKNTGSHSFAEIAISHRKTLNLFFGQVNRLIDWKGVSRIIVSYDQRSAAAFVLVVNLPSLHQTPIFGRLVFMTQQIAQT